MRTARSFVYYSIVFPPFCQKAVFTIQSFFLRSASTQLNKHTKRFVRLNDSTFPFKRNRNETIALYCHIPYLCDTENLTFSEKFRGCSAQTPADSCAEQRRSSAERPWIFCAGNTNFPRIRAKNGGNQKANFVRNNNARIKKDSTRIVQIIIVGLDSLSPSSVPVESG